ncbi:MAG: ComF family protein [Lachnospiraceae bacterium]|nr:ComF family protein [Lachnospiraceae bacterium]
MIKELLYPPKCVACGAIIPGKTYICPRCKKRLMKIKEPMCIVCGKQLEDEEMEICYDCSHTKHEFEFHRSVFLYEERAKKLMYGLKYGHNRDCGAFFATEIVKDMKRFIQALGVDGIVPIPLHKEREKQRGYNQAEIIAKIIGKECNILVYPDYLIRGKRTRPQKELNQLERKNNVENAFHVKKNAVQLKEILLVDDIYTTGTTMDAASRALKQEGVSKVYCLTACIGRGF